MGSITPKEAMSAFTRLLSDEDNDMIVDTQTVGDFIQQRAAPSPGVRVVEEIDHCTSGIGYFTNPVPVALQPGQSLAVIEPAPLGSVVLTEDQVSLIREAVKLRIYDWEFVTAPGAAGEGCPDPDDVVALRAVLDLLEQRP